jgi:hypothetical protein
LFGETLSGKAARKTHSKISHPGNVVKKNGRGAAPQLGKNRRFD